MNGITQKHWLGVLIALATDALLLVLGIVIASEMRLGVDWISRFPDYFPSILLGAFTLGCACYTFGLYGGRSGPHGFFTRSILLSVCVLITVGVMLAAFYVNFSGRIGRGIMLPGMTMTCLFVLLHHAFLIIREKAYRDRVVLMVTSDEDEKAWHLLETLGNSSLDLVGVVTASGHVPNSGIKVLGDIKDMEMLVVAQKIDRIVCTNAGISTPSLYSRFSQLRYSGVPVMPLISLCEELYHRIPIGLVTPEWLMVASGSPHVFYIRKLKRAFDILASLCGLVILGPFLVVGAIVIKLGSRGPVFFRQRRSGRFEKPFEVIKLRTMRVDAEKNGAQWASANDTRAVWGGNFLRKFRIDEIPQLVNVLRGEMSFVGPRPERPEFVKTLAKEIPFYEERMMVQPGITGWAQVNYPYGASVEDARRKLEYDLYYMKNMSLFLDMFILLDTVRIILQGGTKAAPINLPEFGSAALETEAYGEEGTGIGIVAAKGSAKAQA